MALVYARFDSYDSVGYVVTLHISPFTICPYLPIAKRAFFGTQPPRANGVPPTEEKTIRVENIDRHVYATPLKCPETITSIKSCCYVTRYT